MAKAIKEFDSITTVMQLKKKVQYIVAKYITPGCDYEINIDTKTRFEILAYFSRISYEVYTVPNFDWISTRYFAICIYVVVWMCLLMVVIDC